MATWIRIAQALLSLGVLAACNDPQVELLVQTLPSLGDELVFRCEGGETLNVPREQRDDTLACLGLDCYTSSLDPSSAECQQKTRNPAADTCVARFFSCFRPAGACTKDDSGGFALFQAITFANGARKVLPDDGYQSLHLYAPNADEPCLLGGKTGFGSPEEATWVRPLD